MASCPWQCINSELYDTTSLDCATDASPALIRHPTRISTSLTVIRSRLPSVLRWLIAPLSVALASCTDPASIGDRPGFYGLVSGPEWRIDTIQGMDLPPDQCPPFTPAVGAITRRRITGSTGTIALPTAGVLSAEFGADRGTVFRIPGEGLIAVAYDDDLPVIQSESDGARRDPIIYNGGYQTWCGVSVAGRPAALFVSTERLLTVGDDTTAVVYSEFMALTTTTPAGRRVNVVMQAGRPRGGGFEEFTVRNLNRSVTALLSYVASIAWQ